MKQQIKRGLFYIAIGFAGLFCLRLGYGYLATPGQPGQQMLLNGNAVFSAGIMTSEGGRAVGQLKANYATERLLLKREKLDYSIDQKYEKVASITSKTNAFDEDEKRIQDASVKYNGLIQFEQSVGVPGDRRVTVAIGVPPERFDPIVAELKGIGELSSIRIDKTDKTNEYKELKAKQASLEKARDALISLKSKSGRIDEFTNLENRILEIEEQIQSSGVQLGDYDQENEFCTVKLTLEEKTAAVKATISFRHRVVVALAWTVRYYAIVLAILCLAALLSLLGVVLLQRLNVIPQPAVRRESAGD